MAISRRELFKRFGQSAVCLAVSDLIGLKGALGQSAGSAAASQEYDYRSWENLYRKKWTWDKIVHSTHQVGCSAQCEWNIFVKDGVAFKEEQIEHPRSQNPELPDPGPQGCQRGACYTSVMYGPGRLKYPLKRVGQRGEGKWMRVSWDQALTEAADAIIDAMVKDQGGRSIVSDFSDQTPLPWRLFNPMLGAIQPDVPVTNGDQNMGYYATFGAMEQDLEGEPIFEMPNSTNIFNADVIFIWHWNPLYTFIPYYKEFSQARYRGAEIITVAPDLSPSAVHADYWIPVEPGSDAALALGMCQVIVEEKLYKPAFLKEQTDLPFLVREDTQRFLRESDLKSGGRDDQFYVYDLHTHQVVPARTDTLELGPVDPALEGRYEAELSEGKKVAVRPVFDRLQETLKNYRPERAAEIISRPFAKVHPDVIRQVARKTAKARTMLLTSRHNMSKNYHMDLMNRSIALFLILSGHAKGGGEPGNFWIPGKHRPILWALYGDMETDDVEAGVAAYQKRNALIEETMKKDPTLTVSMARSEMEKQERGKARGREQMTVPGWQWMYYRAGFKDRFDNQQWHDPHYRDFPSYVEEANRKGWYNGFIGPDKEKVPLRDRVLISAGGNCLRRYKGSKVIFDHWVPGLEKIITIDYRMSTTGLYADLVLPCAGYYEQTLVRGEGAARLWLIDKAVDPPGEAKSDWDIICLLAKKISERAKQRGIGKIYDARTEKTLELDKLYDRFTKNGAIKEGDEAKQADTIFRLAGKLGIYPQGLNLEEARKLKGVILASTPASSATIPPFAGPLPRDKTPHPTLTRRMQFYLDHEWFIEAGEAMPIHRDPPPVGGNYPFVQSGGHGRESVQTVWIANPLILRMTRGVPSLFVNKETAERLGIADYEEVEVYNDAGLYRVRVKHSALVRPNQVIVYHCWENFQFSKGNYNMVNPGAAKPLLLAGGYGHLTYSMIGWQPEVHSRSSRVNLRKLGA